MFIVIGYIYIYIYIYIHTHGPTNRQTRPVFVPY